MSEQSDWGWRSIPLDEPVEVKAGEPTWFETDGQTAWESRMSARASQRHHAQVESAMAEMEAEREAWLRAHPPLSDEDHAAMVEAARSAYIAKVGPHSTSAETPGADVDQDLCRDCYKWRPIGNWPGVYCWKRECRACNHEHHAHEVWMA